MDEKWHYSRGGVRAGPVSVGELKQLAAAGRLSPDDLVWRAGMAKWVAARVLNGLFLPPPDAPLPLPPALPLPPTLLPRPEPVPLEPDWDERPRCGRRTRPALWNPNAAANWSILLTPAFGAILHAINWRTLGDRRLARANLVWAGAFIAFLVVVSVRMIVVPVSSVFTILTPWGWSLFLFGWYFIHGRTLGRCVRDELDGDYERCEWAAPLVIAFSILVVRLGVVLALSGALGAFRPAGGNVDADPPAVDRAADPSATDPTADEVAANIRANLLREWIDDKKYRGATIQAVALTHTGGNRYDGFVEATVGGKRERLALDATVDGRVITWRVRPGGNPWRGAAPPSP